jgi:Zn-dependent membrane protease YugP
MLKSKFKKFSKQTLSANLSGKENAEKMLSDHGNYDV